MIKTTASSSSSTLPGITSAHSSSSFLPSLHEIQKLTDLNDIDLLLKDVLAREHSLELELEESLKQTERVEATLEIMEILPYVFGQKNNFQMQEGIGTPVCSFYGILRDIDVEN
jgi:hypothetical protein